MKLITAFLYCCLATLSVFPMKSFAADKVVVIPMNGKNSSQTCTPQVAEQNYYLSIPGAAFMPAYDSGQTIRRIYDIGYPHTGTFANNQNTTENDVITPIYFPPGTTKLKALGFAICDLSASGATVVARVFQRSMVDGLTTELLSHTIDNSAKNKVCHTLYQPVAQSVISIDTETNAYFLVVEGLFTDTDLDYLRLEYSKDVVTQYVCQ